MPAAVLPLGAHSSNARSIRRRWESERMAGIWATISLLKRKSPTGSCWRTSTYASPAASRQAYSYLVISPARGFFGNAIEAEQSMTRLARRLVFSS